MTAEVTTETRNPFDVQEPGTALGDYVETTIHGYKGRVYQTHYGCPENAAWLAMQSPEVQEAVKVTNRWVSILVHDGGAVAFPETLVKPTAPFVLDHQCSWEVFGEGIRNGVLRQKEV